MTGGYQFPEFTLHVKPSNKNASYVIAAALVSAAASVGVCFFIDRYRGIFGLIAMIFFTVAILFYTKYSAAEYTYDLTSDSEGMPILVIKSRTGRRITTLLRLDLYAVRKIERLTQSELKGKKSDTGVLKYTYTPSFLPSEVIFLTVRSHYERADVIIEAPREFEEILAASVENAVLAFGEDGLSE